MKSVLIPVIEFNGFQHFVIRLAGEIFQNQGSDNDVDRCVGSRVCFLAIKRSEHLLIDFREDVIRKSLGPGILKHLQLSIRKKCKFVEKRDLL